MAQASGTHKYVGDVTVDPASTDDGNAAEVVVSLPGHGIKVGDIVHANKDTDDNTYLVASWVSAKDQLTFAFFNPSGGTVNAASQTIRVIVF